MKRHSILALIATLALVASQANAQSLNATGMKWVGSENLAGYGKLSFHFQEAGKVTMFDAKETSHGSWTIDPQNKVVLRFYNGNTEYVGWINGNEMKGTASNGKISWDWKVLNATPVAQAPPASNSGPSAGPSAGPASKAKLTPQNLPDLLKKHGVNFKIETPEVGAPYCVLHVDDKDSGWNFIIEASVDSRGTMWLLMRLDQATDLKAAKLTQLLEANNVLAPCFFIYRAEDSRICLKLECLPNNFRNDMANLMRVTRESHSLWQVEAKTETP